jgi:arginase family enzyme
MLSPLEALTLLLRPAGGGRYQLAHEAEGQLRFQERWYRVSGEEEVQRAFFGRLEAISRARGVLLGIPSDAGAGHLRGASLAPLALREELLRQDAEFVQRTEAAGLVDVGDVLVVPPLLHDEMLSASQLLATRQALYPGLPEALPVSPLSIAEVALGCILAINPAVKPFVIGGDHSTALPVARALSRVRQRWGIVQADAHSDLLEERLGVKYCFSTWSFHANALLGRGGRMIQVGLRGTDRARWEKEHGVRQLLAEEARVAPGAAIDRVIAWVREAQLTEVYFSNDIDATDEAFADATGTPEPDGLHPDFVVELIRRLGREVGLCAGDVMEAAPSLQRTPGGGQKTLAIAARYLRATLEAGLQASL